MTSALDGWHQDRAVPDHQQHRSGARPTHLTDPQHRELRRASPEAGRTRSSATAGIVPVTVFGTYDANVPAVELAANRVSAPTRRRSPRSFRFEGTSRPVQLAGGRLHSSSPEPLSVRSVQPVAGLCQLPRRQRQHLPVQRSDPRIRLPRRETRRPLNNMVAQGAHGARHHTLRTAFRHLAYCARSHPADRQHQLHGGQEPRSATSVSTRRAPISLTDQLKVTGGIPLHLGSRRRWTPFSRSTRSPRSAGLWCRPAFHGAVQNLSYAIRTARTARFQSA